MATTLNYKWINFGTPYGEYKDDITTYDFLYYADPDGEEGVFTHSGKTYKYEKTKTINNLTYEIYFTNITIEPDIRLQYVAEI